MSSRLNGRTLSHTKTLKHGFILFYQFIFFNSWNCECFLKSFLKVATDLMYVHVKGELLGNIKIRVWVRKLSFLAPLAFATLCCRDEVAGLSQNFTHEHKGGFCNEMCVFETSAGVSYWKVLSLNSSENVYSSKIF